MKWRSLFVTAALPLVLCIACQNQASESVYKASASDQAASADTSGMAAYDSPEPSPAGQPKPGNKSSSASTVAADNPDWDRKIVKTADMSVEVKDFKKYSIRLHDIVKQSGGSLLSIA